LFTDVPKVAVAAVLMAEVIIRYSTLQPWLFALLRNPVGVINDPPPVPERVPAVWATLDACPSNANIMSLALVVLIPAIVGVVEPVLEAEYGKLEYVSNGLAAAPVIPNACTTKLRL
jgi:hypothetical protein